MSKAQLERMPPVRRSGLPECSGGLTLAVNNDTITVDELIQPTTDILGPAARKSDFEQFKKYAKPQLERFLRGKISDLVLYQRAKQNVRGDIDEALDKAAQEEVEKFVAEFEGNYAEAENALRQMGKDWKSFREEQKKRIITHFFLSRELAENKPVTHSELLDYYGNIKPEFYAAAGTIEFRLIDIEARKLPEANGNGLQFQQAKAKEAAESIVRRIEAGEDFCELAKEYSHGHRASLGGLWEPVQLGSLAEPYDVLEKKAHELEPGQIAGPVETSEHIFILKLERKQEQGFEPFEKVQHDVEKRLLLERRKRALDKLLARCIQQADIGDIDTFIDLCVHKIYEKYNR